MDLKGAYEGGSEGSKGEGAEGGGGGGGERRNIVEIGVSGKVKKERGSTTALAETSKVG
jgi:hypothetical protein